MKKALLIGLIVSVLAVGGIGAAFATSMTIPIHSLAVGWEDLQEIDVDGIVWMVESDEAYVDAVRLHFSETLIDNTEFDIRIYGETPSGPNDYLWRGWFSAPNYPATTGTYTGWYTFGFPNLDIADIYSIRVIVAEKVLP